jgi:hypothetical protein
MPCLLPDTHPLEKCYYQADRTLSLGDLDVEKISQMTRDLDWINSEKEHYITGWMNNRAVVLIRNYQDKRGTSNGIVMTNDNDYRLSVQAIRFRIPKVLLWFSLRRRSRDLAMVAYQALGEQATSLQQWQYIKDSSLKTRLENDWQQLNDYLGMACWQMENGQPLWQQLTQQITQQMLADFAQSALLNSKKVLNDGEFLGRWIQGAFIGYRANHPALLINWQQPQSAQAYSYLYTLRAGSTQASVQLRCKKEGPFFALNPFDAEHLQRALSLLIQARELLNSDLPEPA